jgi:integrase
MQTFLDKKAETLSRSIVDHLRWDLNDVFKTALAVGLVESNPAVALFTPACKPEGEKSAVSPEEIRVALGILSPRERLIFRMAVFDGMRREILAIRIGHISGESVLIDQRTYRGNQTAAGIVPVSDRTGDSAQTR